LEARRNGGGPGQRNARHVDPEHRDARHEVDGDGIDPAFRALAEAVANDVVGRRVDELRAAGERRYAEAVALVHEVADRLADAEAERRRASTPRPG
jgi:hypothetical protein